MILTSCGEAGYPSLGLLHPPGVAVGPALAHESKKRSIPRQPGWCLNSRGGDAMMPGPQPGASCSRAGATAVVQTLPPALTSVPARALTLSLLRGFILPWWHLVPKGSCQAACCHVQDGFWGQPWVPSASGLGASLLQRGNLGLRTEQAHAPWPRTPLHPRQPGGVTRNFYKQWAEALLGFLLPEGSAQGAVGAPWGSQFFGQAGALASRGSH